MGRVCEVMVAPSGAFFSLLVFVLFFLSHPDMIPTQKPLRVQDGVFHSKSNEWTKIRAIDSGLVF